MNHPAQPAPSKWAMAAARNFSATIIGLSNESENRLAAIITRHHAAAQAETVALLEECAEKIPPTIKLMNNEIAVMRYENLLLRLNKHLAQLKEGAP